MSSGSLLDPDWSGAGTFAVGFDEEVMRGRNVIVNQQWDDALELGHGLFLSYG